MKRAFKFDRFLWLLVALPLLPFAIKASLSDYSAFDAKAGTSGWFEQTRQDATPVTNAAYETECGSCHFAYPPELLPARSWQHIMATLDDHFGDNAELSAPLQTEILHYLSANNADTSVHSRPQSIYRSIETHANPLRISETPYFKRKHHRIDAQAVKNNPEIGSFSQCNACHVHARQGIFNGHDVRIPPLKTEGATQS